jgi:hypothetical protein
MSESFDGFTIGSFFLFGVCDRILNLNLNLLVAGARRVLLQPVAGTC